MPNTTAPPDESLRQEDRSQHRRRLGPELHGNGLDAENQQEEVQ